MLYAMYATDFSRAFFGLDRTPVAGHVRVYKMRKGRIGATVIYHPLRTTGATGRQPLMLRPSIRPKFPAELHNHHITTTVGFRAGGFTAAVDEAQSWIGRDDQKGYVIPFIMDSINHRREQKKNRIDRTNFIGRV